MRNVRKILILSCCLGMLWVQAGCDIQLGSWSQAKFERTVERKAPLADGSTLAAQTSHGSITVTGAPRLRGDKLAPAKAGVTGCTVVAEISGRVSKKKLKGTIGQGTGKLHLQTGSGSISLI